MRGLSFFDLNAVLGAPVFNPDSGTYIRYGNEQDLLSSMDYYGIRNALVSSFRSRAGRIRVGNEEVLRCCKKHPRLYPCFYILPSTEGKEFSSERIEEVLRANSVKAVRLPFGLYNVSPGVWLWEDILEVLEKHRILCILELPTQGVAVPDKDDYYMDALLHIGTSFPNLSFVTAGRLRGYYRVMEKCPNMLFSLEWDPHPGIVEDVVSRFGGDRLLFGTPYSENAKGISAMNTAMVKLADIPEEDRAHIAGGNLANIMDIDLEGKKDNPQESDSSNADEGNPYKVLDIHVHVQPFSWEYKPCTDAESLLNIMNKAGIEIACINGTEGILGGNTFSADEDMRIASSKEKKFVWFAVIHPWFEGNSEYITRCFETLGCAGMKIHPRTHECDITDEKYGPVWEASVKYKVPILSHTGEGQAHSDPIQFAEIAEKYPEGRFILGHTGETFRGMNTCIDLLNRYDNLWAEISGWCFLKKGYLEYLMQRVPKDRILFGSDFGWLDPRAMLGVVLYADIPEEVKRCIFWENAKALWKGGNHGPFKG